MDRFQEFRRDGLVMWAWIEWLYNTECPDSCPNGQLRKQAILAQLRLGFPARELLPGWRGSEEEAEIAVQLAWQDCLGEFLKTMKSASAHRKFQRQGQAGMFESYCRKHLRQFARRPSDATMGGRSRRPRDGGIDSDFIYETSEADPVVPLTRTTLERSEVPQALMTALRKLTGNRELNWSVEFHSRIRGEKSRQAVLEYVKWICSGGRRHSKRATSLRSLWGDRSQAKWKALQRAFQGWPELKTAIARVEQALEEEQRARGMVWSWDQLKRENLEYAPVVDDMKAYGLQGTTPRVGEAEARRRRDELLPRLQAQIRQQARQWLQDRAAGVGARIPWLRVCPQHPLPDGWWGEVGAGT
jgi:hypothetical protein